MSYIKRDKAIDKLRRRKALFCKNQIEFKLLPTNDKSRVDEIDACIAMLINMPPEDVQPVQWIPCSERLPDVAQRVLLSGHGQVMVGMLHSFGKYSLEPTGISYVYPKDDIEAWMPLPEPYQDNRKGADNDTDKG